MEVPRRPRSIPGNDENLCDAGAGQPCQIGVKYGKAFDSASNDVWYRFHTLLAKSEGERDCVLEIRASCVGNVNTRTKCHDVGEPFDALRLKNGRLDGVFSDEVLNGKLLRKRIRKWGYRICPQFPTWPVSAVFAARDCF